VRLSSIQILRQQSTGRILDGCPAMRRQWQPFPRNTSWRITANARRRRQRLKIYRRGFGELEPHEELNGDKHSDARSLRACRIGTCIRTSKGVRGIREILEFYFAFEAPAVGLFYLVHGWLGFRRTELLLFMRRMPLAARRPEVSRPAAVRCVSSRVMGAKECVTISL